MIGLALSSAHAQFLSPGAHGLVTHPRLRNVGYLSWEGLATFDGGVTWEEMPFGPARAAELAPDPLDPHIAYGITLGTTAGDEDDTTRTLARLMIGEDEVWTIATWSTFQDVPSSVATHPEDPDRLFIGTVHGGLWSSLDRGQHWQLIFESGSPDIAPLYLIRVDPMGYVYVNDPLDPNRLLRSGDNGTSWMSIEPAGEERHVESLVGAFNARLPLYLHVAGCDAPGADECFSDAVYRSDDRGDTWRKVLELEITISLPTTGLTRTRGLAVDPLDGDRVALAHGRDVFLTETGGADWESETLPTTAMREYTAQSVGFLGEVSSRLMVTVQDVIFPIERATSIRVMSWGSVKRAMTD